MNQRSSDARIQDQTPGTDPAGGDVPAGPQPLRAIVRESPPEPTGPPRGGDLKDTERRIARLERQNRWLKLSVVVIFVIGGLYIGQTVLPPDTIVKQTLMESRELKLLDSDGHPRMFLRMYSRVPVLQLLDKKGKPRMSLGLRFDDTPFLDLSDKSGRKRAMIEVNKDGQPLIELYDKSGNSTTHLR